MARSRSLRETKTVRKRIGALRLWRPKSVSRYAVKAPARAKMRRCSGRISDLPRSIFPGAVRVGGDGEDRDGTIVAIGDQCQRPCTIDRNAGRSEPGLESRDHRRRVSLEVEHRKPVVGNELLRIGRIELLTSTIDSSGAIATFCGGPTTRRRLEFANDLGRRSAEIDECDSPIPDPGCSSTVHTSKCLSTKLPRENNL